MSLFSNTISTLEKSLDYSSLKQKVISNNIANSDTPNYKAKDVSFQRMFTKSLMQEMSINRTDPRHFDIKKSGSSAIVVNRNSIYNNNGNSVDVDKEMSDLATNQIYFNAVTDRISGKFSSLQTVIKGGK